MSTYQMTKSDELYARAKDVIPGGIHGHYGYGVRQSGPKFFERSRGAHFWDVDGNEYIDYMCAYGPMILGYNHPRVDEAAARQYAAGNTVSLAAPAMVELAEVITDMVQIADWSLFYKNGGDTTAHAVMISRAATGRNKIVKINEGYHGVAPWMQDGRPGTIPADGQDVISVLWNDVAALQAVMSEHGDDIACFISSPYDHPVFRDNEMPSENYWSRVEKICKDNGTVLIVDDVRAGFRINLAGSNVAFNFKPDLVCFGKALGNGYPISALVGTDALKQTAQEVFFTGTQFFNASPMAAATATLRELQELDASNLMIDIGTRLNRGLIDVASSNGFDLVASGNPAMPYYRLEGVPARVHFEWVDECVKRGVYLLGYHNHFISTAHNDADLQRTWSVADEAFKALLAAGTVDESVVSG